MNGAWKGERGEKDVRFREFRSEILRDDFFVEEVFGKKKSEEKRFFEIVFCCKFKRLLKFL